MSDYTEADYRKDVKDYADELAGCIRDKEIADRESFFDRLRETCDGAQCVIYTYQAKRVCLYSDNSEAGFTEGLVEVKRGEGLPWSQMAYCALEADILEELDRMGIDVNRDDFGIEEEESDVDELKGI